MSGATVRVWAPAASTVVVDLTRHEPITATAEPGGWWSADLPADAADETGAVDYAFRLDDGDPLPDPRSRWQPAGVHGFSRTFDPTTHRWADAGFTPTPLSDATIYEIHVGTFSPEGTFLGAIDHLDHLVELGITHIELLPVAAFAGRHGWGYDGVDLYAPHPAYGSPAELQQLVDAAHGRGLAVLLDVVYNHLGPEGNYLSRFGPYFTDRYRTPWGEAVNVDGPGSDEVRRFIIDNALMWLRDHHIDGLRLDAMHAVIDTSATHLLEQLRREVDDLGRTLGKALVLVAEYEGNDPRVVTPLDRGGFALDAQWDDDVHHALHTAMTGETTSYYEDYAGLEDLAACLRDGVAYAGRWSPHRQRTIGRPFTAVDGDRLVACVQNHDQVGNRARGERAAQLMGPARQQVAAALLLTGPFVPLLFQGEDWAASSPFPFFADHEGELAEAVRRGRLAEFAAFGWAPEDVADPEDPATFAEARLRWDEVGAGEHAEMAAWYRALLALRRAHPDLRGRALGIDAVVDAQVGSIVVPRGELVVAALIGPDPATVALPPTDGGPRRVLLASSDAVTLAEGGGVALVPDSVAVVGPEG